MKAGHFAALAYVILTITMVTGCKDTNKRSKQEGQSAAHLALEQERRNCIDRGGQWANNYCSLSAVPTTPSDQCIQQGGQWINGQCQIPQAANCTSLSTVSGALNCLQSRIQDIEFNLSSRGQNLDWVQKSKDDLLKLKNKYNKLRDRNLTNQSGFTAKTLGCLDVSNMQYSASGLNRRISKASSTDQSTMKSRVEALRDALKATKKAIGCLV